MCSWTHNRYDLLSVTMHDCLLLFIICAKSLSAYTQPYSPTTFKLQHIHYTHTYEPPERLPLESQIYSSIGGRPVHTWPRNGKMDIQCLKTERIAHGYMECYNEWTDISRWTHSRMASVPCWLWTMDYFFCHAFVLFTLNSTLYLVFHCVNLLKGDVLVTFCVSTLTLFYHWFRH